MVKNADILGQTYCCHGNSSFHGMLAGGVFKGGGLFEDLQHLFLLLPSI